MMTVQITVVVAVLNDGLLFEYRRENIGLDSNYFELLCRLELPMMVVVVVNIV